MPEISLLMCGIVENFPQDFFGSQALNSDTLCYCLELAGIKGVHQYTGLSQKLKPH